MLLLHLRYTYAISSRHRFPLCCGHLEPKYQPISQPETPHVITSFQSSRLIIHVNSQQILTKISFVIFDIVVKRLIECGLAWHWWNSTDLALVDMFLTILNTEIVAYIIVIIQEITPQPESGKYFQIWFFPRFGGKKWRHSEHAHASYPGLSFRPPGFSPYREREERRVQGRV